MILFGLFTSTLKELSRLVARRRSMPSSSPESAPGATSAKSSSPTPGKLEGSKTD